MKIDKSDALLLYTLLFGIREQSEGSLSDITGRRIQNMMSSLEAFIVSRESHEDEDEDEECVSCGGDHDSGHHDDDEEESSEEDSPEPEDFLGSEALAALRPTKGLVEGEEQDIEFEDTGSESVLDALAGNRILEGVEALKLEKLGEEYKLGVYNGEWHSFALKKPPKSWLKLLSVGVVYGIE